MTGHPTSRSHFSRQAEIEPFITKDGSTIRELMHPASHAIRQQSLAEATVAAGASTLLHLHHVTEEIYHITTGHGLMRLGAIIFEVRSGDTVVIAPGTAHNIRNNGRRPLRMLCMCSPAYSHEDTELLEL